MEFVHFIVEEGLIMIPVLYIIGEIVRHTETVPNKWIPLAILIVSVILTPLVIGMYSADTIVQAVLVAGVTVFGHQLAKQVKKEVQE